MELRHLRYFLAVAEELHFGRAAERLHISQPPLSMQIKDLEEELGVELLERTRRQVSLTPPGKLFLRKVRMILSEVENAVEAVQALDRGEADKISIGYKSAFMLQAIAPLLQRFQTHYPDVQLQFTQASTQAQYDAIKDHRLDLGFVDAPPVEAGEHQQGDVLVGIPAVRFRLAMAVPASHSLAQNKSARLSQFARDDFIFIDRQAVPSIYDLHIGLCQQAGFSPRIKSTTSQLPETLTYVAAGHGVCFAPESLIGSWPGLISFIKLKEEAYVTITALTRADHDGKALKAFREILINSSSEGGG